MYCDKHNRDMLPSKFEDKKTGEKGFWCPDCYKEWKDKKQNTPRQDNSALIMDELVAFRKEFNDRMDAMAEYIAKKIIKDEE